MFNCKWRWSQTSWKRGSFLHFPNRFNTHRNLEILDSIFLDISHRIFQVGSRLLQQSFKRENSSWLCRHVVNCVKHILWIKIVIKILYKIPQRPTNQSPQSMTFIYHNNHQSYLIHENLTVPIINTRHTTQWRIENIKLKPLDHSSSIHKINQIINWKSDKMLNDCFLSCMHDNDVIDSFGVLLMSVALMCQD
jgi:hypothetical protein